MSVPDYSQRAEDHGSILILVKQVGHNLKPETFNMVFDRVSRQEYVRIQETQSGCQRGVWLRYKKSYTLESNEWGDFQAHRKVLGLICIGQSNSESDLEQLSNHHEALKKKYSSTLFDSRFVVFGMNSPSNIESSKIVTEEKSPDVKPSEYQPDVCENELKIVERPPSPNKFEKLDPKRLEKLFERKAEERLVIDKEIDKFLESDDENSNRGYKLDGEMLKSQENVQTSDSVISSPDKSASLPWVKNSPQFLFYKSLDQDHKQIEQDLYEFACSLFWVLESKRLDGRMYDKPISEKVNVPVIYAPCETSESVTSDLDSKMLKKRILGRLKKHMGDLSLQASLPIEALGHYTVAADLLKTSNDYLWLASTYESLCAASVMQIYPALHYRRVSFCRNVSYHAGSPPTINKARHAYSSLHSVPNGIEKVESKVQSCLSPDGIIEMYGEAIRVYGRIKGAVIIETECSVKAIRVLILQEKYLEAASFLQNMMLIALQLTEDEKIERFSVISDLYSQVGFHRKAAFFKRVAAMRCVAPQNDSPNWSRCYQLILQTLNGYKLSLDPREFSKKSTYGWPGLQIQVLQELVGTARRMGNNPLAVRHMTFLLHAMFEHISSADRTDFAAQLETLTSKCEGAPVIMALEDTGIIIPPVNLINLPRVKTFKLQNLAPHLRPIKMAPDHKGLLKSFTDFGPFIFSPLQMNKDKTKDPTVINFQWIEGDVCEVSLQLFNPLPFELKVNPMGLMADGIAFETFPACLSLPPESGPYPVNLLGIPRSTGTLLILGYTTHVLGVKSNCRLKDVPAVQKPHYRVQVVPALPQVQVVTSLPKSATFSSLADSTSHVVTSASVSLYAGESQQCAITITGCGNEPIEKVNLFLTSKLDKETESKFFSWSYDSIETQLPVQPNDSATFNLVLNAISNFVCHAKPRAKLSSQKNTPTHSSNCTSPSLQKHAHSDIVGSSSEALQMRVVEALLEIQYTGGPGMSADYCRQCAISINVEVIPSLVITKWDVLPAETPNSCYLVLDILNTTAHEMEVLYTKAKKILIEAHETCRIPVPIQRCPLSMLSEDNSNLSPETICREYISNLVDLRWSLPAIEVEGVASVSDITWTPKMLDSICMSPIHWELLLNDEEYKAENVPSLLVGESLNISIIIRNQSEKSLTSLLLTVQGYQDFQNGNCNYRLEHKRAVIGSENVVINEIKMDDSYKHNFCHIYFCPGTYKLDIQVSNNLQDKRTQSRPSVTSIVTSTNSSHVWKCSPSIELTIVEE